MSNQHVFQLDPLDHNKAKFSVNHKKLCYPECKSRAIKPKEGVALVSVEKALTLALRMSAPGLSFPFGSRRCNSHHYMDYLRYGKRSLNMLFVSRDCPVFGEIDYPNAPDFKLKDYLGNEHPVGPPLQLSPAVTTGQVGDGIRKATAKIIKHGQECLPCFGGNGFPPSP
ncbi:unnamed protein product [Bemisia tabaci]|uniref:Uncharacterized protein n=1 Tax=Bemisia tabaci TaxID=7038 RepID=A0A9P0AI99_BEMTA|nr:unnamed protein product [Bemisia tabaci]